MYFETDALWDSIKSQRSNIDEPVYCWNLTDSEFHSLEDFVDLVVVSRKGRHWKVGSIDRNQSILFLAWVSEYYRRFGTLETDIANFFKEKCKITALEWESWMKIAENSLGRKITQKGSHRYSNRIKREAGLKRRLFEGYHSKLRNRNPYWRLFYQVWCEVDVDGIGKFKRGTSHQLHNKQTQEKDHDRFLNTDFYDLAIERCENIRNLYDTLSISSIDDIQEKWTQWFELSEGLRNFLGDISSSKEREKFTTWRPYASRCLYTSDVPSVWTRIIGKSFIGECALDEINALCDARGLANDCLNVEVHNELNTSFVSEYFRVSGQSNPKKREKCIYLPPLGSTHAYLKTCNALIGSYEITNSLEEDDVWFFEKDPVEKNDICWIYTDIKSAKFPIIASYLKPTNFAMGARDFVLTQPGLQDRVCTVFETLDEYRQSHIIQCDISIKRMSLYIISPLQPIRALWDGKPVKISLGIPKSASGILDIITEYSTTRNGDFSPIGDSLKFPILGYFRGRSGKLIGLVEKLLVLPDDFEIRCQVFENTSAKVEFFGITETNMTPMSTLVNCRWDNLKKGDLLGYRLDCGATLHFFAPITGAFWKNVSGELIGNNEIARSDIDRTCLDVDCPNRVRHLNFTIVASSGNQNIFEITIQSESNANSCVSIQLHSIGDSIVRKLFGAFHYPDLIVTINGAVCSDFHQVIKIPSLQIHRYKQDVSNQYFAFIPSAPQEIHAVDDLVDEPRTWYKVPQCVARNGFYWDRVHAPIRMSSCMQQEYADSSLSELVAYCNDLDQFMDHCLHRFKSGLSEIEWELIESSFSLMREHHVPIGTLWLVQAVLLSDRILGELYSRVNGEIIKKWLEQSSLNGYEEICYKESLIRSTTVDDISNHHTIPPIDLERNVIKSRQFNDVEAYVNDMIFELQHCCDIESVDDLDYSSRNYLILKAKVISKKIISITIHNFDYSAFKELPGFSCHIEDHRIDHLDDNVQKIFRLLVCLGYYLENSHIPEIWRLNEFEVIILLLMKFSAFNDSPTIIEKCKSLSIDYQCPYGLSATCEPICKALLNGKHDHIDSLIDKGYQVDITVPYGKHLIECLIDRYNYNLIQKILIDHPNLRRKSFLDYAKIAYDQRRTLFHTLFQQNNMDRINKDKVPAKIKRLEKIIQLLDHRM